MFRKGQARHIVTRSSETVPPPLNTARTTAECSLSLIVPSLNVAAAECSLHLK